MNFGGVHVCNTRHRTTKLTMRLEGYDASTGLITNPHGGIALIADDGTVAVCWGFASVLTHWNRKHRNAVYVPSKHRAAPENQYRYADSVRMGVGTDALYLLKAIESGKVYYDPGIKLEQASSSKPKTKTRSQFRINLNNLHALYDSVSSVEVTKFCR